MICRLIIQPYGVEIDVPAHTSITEALRRAGLAFIAPCGEKGSCGKCKVLVHEVSGSLAPVLAEESVALSGLDQYGYRLACLATLEKGTVMVSIQKETVIENPRFQLQTCNYLNSMAEIAPQISKVPCILPAIQRGDFRDRFEHLIHSLPSVKGLRDIRFTPHALKQLGDFSPLEDHPVTLVMGNSGNIMAVEKSDTTRGTLGLAVDVGTTKIAGYLIDLPTGTFLASASVINPQIQYGEDLMTRINFSLVGQDNTDRLQQAAVEGIDDIIRQLCRNAGKEHDSIYMVSLVGNPCMVELLLGFTPRSLSVAPYLPVYCRSISGNMPDLGISLPVNPMAEVYFLPAIGGFVGGDNVAAQLATGFYPPPAEGIRLLMDIGTNTEIILQTPEEWLACSCASGSAFEGMHVTHGQKAAVGAIQRVKIDEASFEVTYNTIGGEKPTGICGSGLIDALAELRRDGILEASGRFNKDLGIERLRIGYGGVKEFVLAWREETAINCDLIITEKDIYELMQAKAAIHAGCQILLRLAGKRADDVEELIIAGAFGEYLDAANARAIGLFLPIPTERVKVVGNAAGRGAILTLLSAKYRQQAEEIALRTRHYDLAQDEGFMREYSLAMFLRP